MDYTVHGVEKSQTRLSDFHFHEGQVQVYPAKASHSELETAVMLINSTILLLYTHGCVYIHTRGWLFCIFLFIFNLRYFLSNVILS